MKKILFICCILCLSLVLVFANGDADQQPQTQPATRTELQPETELMKFTEFYVDSEYHLIAGDYIVDHSIYIGATGKLIIDPGTRFFLGKNCGIVCEGKIIAVGTGTKPIEFKASGNARWGSLVIAGQEYDESQVEYCNFELSSDMFVGNSQIYRYFDDDYDPEDLVKVGGAVTLIKTETNLKHCNFSKCNSSRGSAIFVLCSKVWIESCAFTENMTSDGAVFVSDSHCTLRECNFVDNVSTGNAAAISCKESYYRIESEINKPFVDIWRCNFVNNIAEHHGGAITAIGKITVDITDSSFVNNLGGKSCFGGAIASFESILKVSDSKFVNNVGTLGGAIHVSVHNNPLDWMKLEIYNSVFEKNKSARGGAVYSGKIPLTIENSRFVDNEAEDNGGAFVCSEFITFEIYNTKFVGNKAKLGGAAQIDCNDITEGLFQKCEFKQNKASESGGAVSLNLYQTTEEVIAFEDCTFKDNEPNDKSID